MGVGGGAADGWIVPKSEHSGGGGWEDLQLIKLEHVGGVGVAGAREPI